MRVVPCSALLSAFLPAVLLAVLFCSLAAGEAKPSPGFLDATAATALEARLDALCGEADAAKRATAAEALAGAASGLSRDELLALAAGELPQVADGRPGLHLPVPRAAAGKREFFHLLVPGGYDPREALPLVVLLHGPQAGALIGSGDADQVLPASGSFVKAGFAVLMPTSSKPGAAWAETPQVGLVHRLIGNAARLVRLDFRRLAIVGYGHGGTAVWTHLLDQPGVWWAGVAVSGRAPKDLAQRLDRLAGVPLYLFQGEAEDDGGFPPQAERTRAAVEWLTKAKLPPTVVEVPRQVGVPVAKRWDAIAAWLAAQPAQARSPRPLFLPPPGRAALGAEAADPLEIGDDPALALIRAGQARQAIALLDGRLNVKPTRRDHYLRALARLPALSDSFPEVQNAWEFTRSPLKEQWTDTNCHDAMQDLMAALRFDATPPRDFVATVYRLAAMIHARTTLVTIVNGAKNAYADPLNAFNSVIRTSAAAGGDAPALAALVAVVNRCLPVPVPPDQADVPAQPTLPQAVEAPRR